MTYKKSIFSWYREPIVQSDEIFKILSEHQITCLYQMISIKESHVNIYQFLKKAQAYRCEVNFLIGEPEWSLDTDATEAIKIIQTFAPYQRLVKGIVLDIEPHTLDEFKSRPKEVMKLFVKALRTIYKEANLLGFKVSVCIPYYLDTLGFMSELEEVIQDTIDEIAIMNYYRGKEVENIHYEVKLANINSRKIINIYELQPPDTHGLTDKNTYYNYGLKAVYENFNNLKRAYPFIEFELSFHELRYFMELAAKEQI